MNLLTLPLHPRVRRSSARAVVSVPAMQRLQGVFVDGAPPGAPVS